MRGRILFVVGIGVGYVLGTRAGRERYEQLKKAAIKVWNDPRLQEQVDHVQDFVKDKAPEVAEFVADNAKKVVTQARKSKTSTTRAATAKPTTTTTRKTTTPKSTSSS